MSRDGRPEGHESPDHTSTAEFALGEKRVAGPPPVVGQGAGRGPASETVTDRPVDEIAGPVASAGVTAVDGDPMISVTAAPPPAHSAPASGPPSADSPTAVERLDRTAVEGPDRTAVEGTAEEPMNANRPGDTHHDTAVMPQQPGSGETRETIVEAAARKTDGEPAKTEELTRENSVQAGAGDGWTVAPGLGGGTGAGPRVPFAESQGHGQAHGVPGLSAQSVPGHRSLPAGQEPRAGRSRRPVLVAAATAALVVLSVVGILLWPESRPSAGRSSVAEGSPAAQVTPSAGPQGGTTPPADEEPTGTGPGGAPTPALPGEQGPGGTEEGGVPGADSANAAGPAQVPTEAPAGPLRSGDDVTYQLMQRDEGYFEGTFAITNPSSEPMSSWTLTFSVKGANVRNVWGGRLVRGGETATIGNAPGGAAIPPGGSIEVRFGADGAPSEPATCEINGESRGF